MSWDLKERSVDAVTVVEVSGGVALGGGSDALEAELQKLIVNGRDAILLDCSEVTSIDSSGIGALVRCFITLDRRGGKLKLLNPSPTMRMALRVLGLIEAIETFDDQAAALASFN